VSSYTEKFSNTPTKEAVEVELENLKGVPEDVFRSTTDLIEKMFSDQVRDVISKQDIVWALGRTEKYFQERASLIAVMESLEILDGNSKMSIEAIPDILKKAVSITFNTEIGHDYLLDWESRFEEYHAVKTKIPFSLFMLNRVTGGGHEPGTLNLVIAGTGTGKTIVMCNEAGHLLMNGKNVLYVTLEMSPAKISERIDAKLMQMTIDQVKKLKREDFLSNINSIKNKTTGKLIVHQWPPRTITTRHLEALLNDLKVKKNFVPDVVFVDYLTLMNSYTYKGTSDNLYILGKLVAEELRGLAVRKNLSIFSASQTNRNGQNNSDFDLSEMGESHAISQTADFMFGVISTPELEQLGHWRLKLLKSRYGSITSPGSFIVGVDKPMMTVFDVDVREDEAPQNDQAIGFDDKKKASAKFKFDFEEEEQ
jgi:archaellum biogenesis ATPase FlaH